MAKHILPLTNLTQEKKQKRHFGDVNLVLSSKNFTPLANQPFTALPVCPFAFSMSKYPFGANNRSLA
jgi:hypothetical protein